MNADRRQRDHGPPVGLKDRRRGRPARVPGELIVRPVIEMTESEWKAVQEAAERSNQSAAEFMRLNGVGAALDLLEAQTIG